MNDDPCVKALALAVVTRAFLDLRYPAKRAAVEHWFCHAPGRAWVELAGLDYDGVMTQLERALDLLDGMSSR